MLLSAIPLFWAVHRKGRRRGGRNQLIPSPKSADIESGDSSRVADVDVFINISFLFLFLHYSRGIGDCYFLWGACEKLIMPRNKVVISRVRDYEAEYEASFGIYGGVYFGLGNMAPQSVRNTWGAGFVRIRARH